MCATESIWFEFGLPLDCRIPSFRSILPPGHMPSICFAFSPQYVSSAMILNAHTISHLPSCAHVQSGPPCITHCRFSASMLPAVEPASAQYFSKSFFSAVEAKFGMRCMYRTPVSPQPQLPFRQIRLQRGSESPLPQQQPKHT